MFEGEVQTGISMLFDILLNCAIFLLSVVPDCIRHATSISPDLPKYELKPEKPKSYGFGLSGLVFDASSFLGSDSGHSIVARRAVVVHGRRQWLTIY